MLRSKGKTGAMEDVLDEVDRALQAGLFYLALAGALTVPDLCAVAETPELGVRARYERWWDEHLGQEYAQMAGGAVAYQLRCAVLHEGSYQLRSGGFSRVIFLEPGGSIQGHLNIVNDALWLDLPTLVRDILVAGRTWRSGVTEEVESRLERHVRRHPNGLAPYIVGCPVIA